MDKIPDENDDLTELDNVRAIERCGSQTGVFCESQEFMDALFSPFANVPIRADSDNADEFRKLFGSSGTSTTVTPVRRVAPKVTLRDPLIEFNDAGMTKLLKTEQQLPEDHLYGNRDFPKVLDMVSAFTGHPAIRKRIHVGNREAVREAEARVIVSILEALENTRADVASGRL